MAPIGLPRLLATKKRRIKKEAMEGEGKEGEEGPLAMVPLGPMVIYALLFITSDHLYPVQVLIITIIILSLSPLIHRFSHSPSSSCSPLPISRSSVGSFPFNQTMS